MLEDGYAFDYMLAENLGKTLGEIRELPNTEIIEWHAFYTWKNAMEELHKNG